MSQSLPAATHDFDFLHGSWTITNRRLKSRLTGSNDWATFSALATCRPILGGYGNIDDFRPVDWDEPVASEAGALRLYDQKLEAWVIYWMVQGSGDLGTPVAGRFENGVGVFLSDDEHNGQPVRCRFRWTGTTTGLPRWEQAFSTDQGVTWEVNWIMEFTRAEG